MKNCWFKFYLDIIMKLIYLIAFKVKNLILIFLWRKMNRVEFARLLKDLTCKSIKGILKVASYVNKSKISKCDEIERLQRVLKSVL